jgi:hypothetical protein
MMKNNNNDDNKKIKSYKIEKMLEKEKDSKKELIVLILGGSFSPVHNMHVQ